MFFVLHLTLHVGVYMWPYVETCILSWILLFVVFLLHPEEHETLPPLVSDHIFFKHICNLSIQTLPLLCCLHTAA